MLINLQVRNFAIVDRIDLEFAPGMTVLTGETGAGKSILIDALALVLGERGSAQLVRDGARRAEFSAEFDIRDLRAARHWLAENALDQDDSCLLRRVVGSDGRSRAFINGNAVPVGQLKQLGELLIDIHGQHFHQSLGRRQVQQTLLDHFAGLQPLRDKVAAAHASWTAIEEKIRELQDADANREARSDLLTFQLQELQSLSLEAGETDALAAERVRLQHSGRLAEAVAAGLGALYDNDGADAHSLIAEAQRSLSSVVEYEPAIEPLLELLDSASIQISEASDALRRYGDSIDMDPQRRDDVERRLDAITVIARKHRVEPAQLPALETTLQKELDDIANIEARCNAFEADLDSVRATYYELATELSEQRRLAADRFANTVSEAMQGLGMPGGLFEVALRPHAPGNERASGLEDVEFLISANPGQTPQPIAKVASGGELSRMSLSIQVVASDGSAIPTMIFDEVDSGVGGGVAEMVGRRLQELGGSRQVLCVTHLPQVASLAQNHIRIRKNSDENSTHVQAHALDQEQRIDEIARMLGGVEITSTTREHAAEMLGVAAKKRA